MNNVVVDLELELIGFFKKSLLVIPNTISLKKEISCLNKRIENVIVNQFGKDVNSLRTQFEILNEDVHKINKKIENMESTARENLTITVFIIYSLPILLFIKRKNLEEYFLDSDKASSFLVLPSILALNFFGYEALKYLSNQKQLETLKLFTKNIIDLTSRSDTQIEPDDIKKPEQGDFDSSIKETYKKIVDYNRSKSLFFHTKAKNSKYQKKVKAIDFLLQKMKNIRKSE